MKKIDYRKEFKPLLNPKPGVVEFLKVPPLKYLMIDGHGDPNTSKDLPLVFPALYGIAYTMKFAIKAERKIDYSMLAVEGLWYMPDMERFSADRKDEWDWTMMLFAPDFITKADVKSAIKSLRVRKKDSPALDKVRLETYREGLCAQMMHIGPYSQETENIRLLHRTIEEKGYELKGKHHEIYISDPNRTAPAKLKTIIRQPVQKAKRAAA